MTRPSRAGEHRIRRDERPCAWCGRATTARTRTCMSCVGIEARRHTKPLPEHALTGGAWVGCDGVQVWVWGATHA